MTLNNAILDIIFRRINPEEVIAEFGDTPSLRFSELCMTKAESTLGGYSYEEKQNMIRSALNTQHDQIWWDKPPQFDVLAKNADKLLVYGTQGPECRFERIADWREIYLLLGQDILTTSWQAKKARSGPISNNFSWPAVIPVNNPILAQITKDLAENHMHLMAGASTFSLTWCCLMNHPEAIYDATEMDIRLQPFTTRTGRFIWSSPRRIMYAAFLRLILFRRLRGTVSNAVKEFRRFQNEYSVDQWVCLRLSKEIENVRRVCGIKFSQPDSFFDACLDYAFTAELAGQREEPSRLLASERLFLYKCFSGCFDGTLNIREQWLFYVYLLLKSQFRSELVQVNQQVGFHNFHDYDSRKMRMWSKWPEYLNEDYRQTINANLKEQSIEQMEGRISPQWTASEDTEWVFSIDRAYMFHNSAGDRDKLKRLPHEPWMDNPVPKAKHFYVFHFPKTTDHVRRSEHAAPASRHEQYRTEVRTKSIELAKALSNNDYFVQRVRGIDACSFEISCRPEVFGPAFRFLRSIPVPFYRRMAFSTLNPRLGITYHVGEDFLDIADGLRAIDEAIAFLQLARGDRLGHATVLGVDPKTHYERKNRQIIMSKQEALDSCVWLLYRSGELGVVIPSKLRQQMLQRANGLFNEIYRDKITNIVLEDYYLSMKLRGDDPRCYKNSRFEYPRITDGFDKFCIVEGSSELSNLRKQPHIAELCFLHQYCHGVYNKGNETNTTFVTDEYIRLMGQMQEAMREYVNDKGVCIESNPSSNVLIGTFGSYQKHPLLTFYNRGLGIEKDGVQMHVSVNTDDPGIFDTSLTFEYALIADALRNMKDDNGMRLNTDRAIEDYIRDLVRMGREQCFPMCT